LPLALEGEDADFTALLIRSRGGKKANRAVLIRRGLERCHDIAVAAELMLARPKVRVQADGSGCEDLRARGGLTMEDISANRPRRDGMIFRCEAEDDARGLGTDRRLRGGRGDSKRHSLDGPADLEMTLAEGVLRATTEISAAGGRCDIRHGDIRLHAACGQAARTPS